MFTFHCLGTHCLEAYPPPTETGLVVSGWDGNIIEVDSKIDYKCFRGSKFTHDFSQEKVQSTCLPENLFELPDWGQCIDSKFCL